MKYIDLRLCQPSEDASKKPRPKKPISQDNQIEDSQIRSLMLERLSLLGYSPYPVASDLIYIRPETEKVFLSCCSTLEVDVITLPLEERMSFNIKRTNANQALNRGVFFEVQYAHLLRDPISRRNTITNARTLFRNTRGKNLIVSSGAKNASELRSPKDVINLIAVLFDIDPMTAMRCMSENVRRLLQIAAARRQSFKGVVTDSIENNPFTDLIDFIEL